VDRRSVKIPILASSRSGGVTAAGQTEDEVLLADHNNPSAARPPTPRARARDVANETNAFDLVKRRRVDRTTGMN
jgi:hypothetical protein